MENSKLSVIGLGLLSRIAQAPDGGELQRLFLTIENIGPVAVIEFQAELSVNGTEWEQLHSVCLRNDPRSFERMPPNDLDFGPILRLAIRKKGIYVNPRQTLYVDCEELRTMKATNPRQVHVRYRYRYRDGTPFESDALCEFALVTEEP